MKPIHLLVGLVLIALLWASWSELPDDQPQPAPEPTRPEPVKPKPPDKPKPCPGPR